MLYSVLKPVSIAHLLSLFSNDEDEYNEDDYEDKIFLILLVLAHKPASFWKENAMAIVILPQVLVRMSLWQKQAFKFLRSFIILRSGEGSTSFNKDSSSDFFNGKKVR